MQTGEGEIRKIIKIMKSKDLRKRLLETSSSFREEYFKRDLALDIGHMVVRERIIINLTQAELARLVGTKQPGIARTERGNTLPQLGLLERIANALGMHLFLEFRDTETYTNTLPGDSIGQTKPVISPFYSMASLEHLSHTQTQSHTDDQKKFNEEIKK